jgi:hypothetical protein
MESVTGELKGSGRVLRPRRWGFHSGGR